MPRAATTADAFNAVAEKRRRDIIDALSDGKNFEVGELVIRLGMAQPAVSKHLGVLRKVGLVSVQRRGQHRIYSLNAQQLRPVHEWVKTFERFWSNHLDTIKAQAENRARERAKQKTQSDPKKPNS